MRLMRSMKKKYIWTILVFSCTLFIFCANIQPIIFQSIPEKNSFFAHGTTSHPVATVAIDDWPMFGHDPAHTGYSTSTAPQTNQTLFVKLVAFVPASGKLGGISINNDKAYVSTAIGSKNPLSGVNAHTGVTFFIKNFTDATYGCSPSPVVDDNFIY